ncbi:hypothetical protein COCC4DRAFT_31480 [Bipolaris maydis ATCC 48331]|uniref:Uncharacterized protein n=2 Tax=Cochliobolus heterostrophus TaxID=5016 RepID=M2TI33_COCH5|nr:uncharacterized protein COCC4DRAFT_31480 [Bipolaris maydis ATCC 48331]EMD86164.1 hypothetical protein COCHEDRAFT_1023935 [Bipolaris maydis C5]ENI06113.1 hypothetical protein COCC4DRAFT_31480 [Bipolaris maydis ATCC 48331]
MGGGGGLPHLESNGDHVVLAKGCSNNSGGAKSGRQKGSEESEAFGGSSTESPSQQPDHERRDQRLGSRRLVMA